MANAKKYILTGVTLGSIAAVAAGLISVTNLVTAKKIKQNEEIAVNQGISSIFGENQIKKDEGGVSDRNYVTYFYEVDYKESGLEMHGYAFKCEGSNMYGKIALIAGFNAKSEFMSLYLVKNEQTYASTLVDNYINPVNSHNKDYETDVSCGATYGAKLVRDMLNEAKEVSIEFWSRKNG